MARFLLAVAAALGTAQGGVEATDGTCDVDTDLCDEACDVDLDLCDEGVGGDFACTLEQLATSATLSGVWDQYCSTMTTGAKSFAMTLDCKDAGFDNVSGEMSQSYAGAMTRCITPNNATNCKIFDKMGAQCTTSTAKHILKINVQADATTFSYDGRALVATRSALAELLGGIDVSQITTVMEVLHCGSDSECPADESTTMATGAAAGEAAATTEAVGDVGNSGSRRLDARSSAGESVRGRGGRQRSRDALRSAGARPAIPVPRPRGIPHRSSAGASVRGSGGPRRSQDVLRPRGTPHGGRALTAEGREDMDDLDGTSEDGICAPDVEFELCDGELPAGAYTPSESYGCVCGLEGQCPFDPDDDLCDGLSFVKGQCPFDPDDDLCDGQPFVKGQCPFDPDDDLCDGQPFVEGQCPFDPDDDLCDGQPFGATTTGRGLAETERDARDERRAVEAKAASQFGTGRRLGSRGVGGAVVIVTSTISASPADIKFFTDKHDAMGSNAVWFLDNKLHMHLARHGMGVQSAVPGRVLTSGPQHGVVQVTSSEVVGEESVQPEAHSDPAVDGQVEASTWIIVVVGVVVLCVLASLLVPCYCIRARRKRRRRLAKDWEPPEADTTLFKMRDPRRGASGMDVPIVAFGSGNGVSEACCSLVLEGGFDMASLGGLRVQAPADPDAKKFLSAEAAFLALPFWSRADAFQDLQVQEARDMVANELRGTEDTSHRLGGFANHWVGMKAILEVKFKEFSLAKALLSTQDSFLLLHSSAGDGDKMWSDNSDGEGENKLGMLLMIIRDEIAPPRVQTWSDFIKELYDMDEGVPRGVEESKAWQQIVRAARAAVVDEPLVAPPSAVDVPPEESLQVNIKVGGISFSGLESHRPSRKEFDALVKQTLAERAGNNLQPSDVAVRIYAGSVVADAAISCPPGISPSKLRSDLCASGNLPAILTHRISGMSHLDMVQEGCIHVDVAVDGVPLILVDPEPAEPTSKQLFLETLRAAPVGTFHSGRGLEDGTDRGNVTLVRDMVLPVPSKEYTFLSQQAPVPGGTCPSGKQQRNKIPSPAPVERGLGKGGGDVKSAAAPAVMPKVPSREGLWSSPPGELFLGSVDPKDARPKNKIPLALSGHKNKISLTMPQEQEHEGVMKVRISGRV